MITIRPMTADDFDFMLELKNYDETRKFAIQSQNPIKREYHIKFMEKNVDQFRIIQDLAWNDDTKSSVGQIRVGAYRINGMEISIWISREYRGKQIALKTINQVSFCGMIARIVDGNIASFRTFIKAGFLPIGRSENEHATNYYILEKP